MTAIPLAPLLAIGLTACDPSVDRGPPRASQGQWADLASTTRLRVSEVTGCRDGDVVELEVAWELENIGPAAEVFNWRNKVVIAADGRRFSPARGESTPELAPGQRSPLMRTAYRLPAHVATESLAWGLFTENKLQYRVSLLVPSLRDCVTAP